MRQHAVAAPHQLGAELGDGVQAIQVRQFAVGDGKVDVKEFVGDFRHAVIDAAFEIDHGIDSAIEDRLPIGNGGGEVELSVVIHLNDVAEEVVHHLALAAGGSGNLASDGR